MATSSIEFAQFVLNKIMEITAVFFIPNTVELSSCGPSFMDYKFLRGSIKRSKYIISWRAWLI